MTLNVEFLKARNPLETSLNIGRAYAPLAALMDGLLICVTLLATGFTYHKVVLHAPTPTEIYWAAGGLVSVVYISLMVARRGYDLRARTSLAVPITDMMSAWTMALLVLALALVLTKSAETYSRGTLSLFAGLGFVALLVGNLLQTRALKLAVRDGAISLGRVILIGTSDRVSEFARNVLAAKTGLTIDGIYILGDGDNDPADAAILQDVAERIRKHTFDDVYLLLPWSQAQRITRCSMALMSVPARLHVGIDQVFPALPGVKLETSSATTLSLARGPLELSEQIAKRALDLVVASLGLIILSPVLLWAAVAIKLDSPGPILFRQRRHGFNQSSFDIYKFRSMYVDEGGEFRQATRNDARITRIGHFLRKTSIDELPQLLNVLKGEMSIVGPRPHPTKLDEMFEPRIAFYARRFNVKPGITGWAQIHGYRGETETDEKMKNRLEYDLYYIENWSLALDFYIMVRTATTLRVLTTAY